ncbi:hypothetical protein DevBK_19375 [Devosia sp. BK]|nr:hypothetical protein [Devosia sp. BK]MDV3253505.1 hypothetical protein [Devosia sp. BK]
MTRRHRVIAFAVAVTVLVAVGVIVYARLVEPEHPSAVHTKDQTPS